MHWFAKGAEPGLYYQQLHLLQAARLTLSCRQRTINFVSRQLLLRVSSVYANAVGSENVSRYGCGLTGWTFVTLGASMGDDEIRGLYERLSQNRSGVPSFDGVLKELKQLGFPLQEMDEGGVRVILLNTLQAARRVYRCLDYQE